MPAYLITAIEVIDPKGYEAYRARVGQSLEEYEAQFLVRGGEIDVLEGDWQPRRIIMRIFDSMNKARKWYRSDGYQELNRLRKDTAAMNLVAVEGV
ncbi:MAG TPA: DUF1330 domain-containing protein [Burkholderiales bacterium]|nr:DUF1330 domain-containing protein [Burkholderiales bacterium]